MLLPLKIPAGIYRNGTNFQAAGRWYDCNLVRFFEGTIRPFGGWQAAATSVVAGAPRGLFAWRDNTFNRWCAIGTHSHLYAFNGGSIYDITPAGFTTGRPSSFPGVGYGFGPYGSAVYGASPVVANVLDATTWSFDNWGQFLVGCSTSDGKLYQWELSSIALAQVIANAPTNCSSLIVSAERYLIALGAGGDPRRVSWSTQEDNTDWTPTSLNTAGGLNLVTNGRIRSARRVRGQIIIWTDSDIHALNYLGPPFIYGTERIGGFCGIISANAMAVIDSGAVWMGVNSFFSYDGAISDIPCDVSDYVFSDFNSEQAAKVYAGLNTKFGEVIWFYCSAASDEIDRYVIYNYREKHWSIGSTLSRTCWTDASAFPFPLAADAFGFLYQHETGWTDSGNQIGGLRYLTAGPVQLADGDKVIDIMQVVPDEKSQGQVELQFSAQFTPEGTQYFYGPFPMSSYVDVRLSGRQISPTINGASDADWRVGQIRFETVQGGRR